MIFYIIIHRTRSSIQSYVGFSSELGLSFQHIYIYPFNRIISTINQLTLVSRVHWDLLFQVQLAASPPPPQSSGSAQPPPGAIIDIQIQIQIAIQIQIQIQIKILRKIQMEM